MHKSTGRLTVFLAAALLPIVTLATAALADDDKTYPGAMCRLITPTIELVDVGNHAVGLGVNGHG
jgi:hypothetical protein